MKVTGRASIDLSAYRASINTRIDQVRKSVAKQMAAGLSEEVHKRIPDGPGWLQIYRDAIKFQEGEEKGVWEVVGEAQIVLTQVPAAKSLAFFEGMTGLATVLKSFNPWPIDTILAIQGGITADLVVRPASETETMTHRHRHAASQTEIKSKLESIGAVLLPYDRPEINGKIVADLKFLSLRLEHGLGGFPRVPHWSAAVAQGKRRGDKWVTGDEATKRAVKDAFSARQI